MSDGGDAPTEPDWKAVAQLVMQQRDRAEQKANNLEIDLAIAQKREADLRAQLPPPLPVESDDELQEAVSGTKDAKQKPEAGAHNGRRRPLPEIREECRHPDEGGPGVQPG